MSGGFAGATGAVAWRGLHNHFHSPGFVIQTALFPLLFFAAFAGGLSEIEKLPQFDFDGGYTAFQFVFVLLESAAFGGVFTGFGIAADFEYGFGRRYMLGAANRFGIVTGYLVSSVVRSAVVWAILTAVALVAGMQVGGDGVDVFGLFGLALLVNVAATFWGAGVALRVRSLQAAGPMIQMPVFLIFFLAPVWVPLGMLTGWIHAVAKVNPVTALLEAGRGLIAGEPELIALAFAITVIAGMLCWAWARGGLRQVEQAG